MRISDIDSSNTRDARRSSYRNLSLYAPNRAPCATDLSDNTNLWGVPPRALETLRDAAVSTVTRYPALYAGELKDALAAYIGVAPECIVTGCGSDDVLDSAIRAFAEPGDRVVYPDPSFAMIPIFAQMNALEPVSVPLRADFGLDVDAMLAADAAVLYVCSPNNPTGTLAARADVERLLAESRGIVIVDEAYAEFVGGVDSLWASEAPGIERLLVVRTMSKAFGLAGLRVGYAIGAPALVAEVEKSRGPYKVNAIAERTATVALTQDMNWVRAHVDEAITVRGRLELALRERALAPIPSASNFVLVALPGAPAIAARMRELGVAVRPFESLPLVGDALRISVGPWEMIETMLAALDEAMAASRESLRESVR
jgi:histidinol-phosphate aminotransferase